MPLSKDPDKRARQLANLRPGAGAWQPGSAPQLRHGLRTRKPPPLILQEFTDRIVEALEDAVPMRGPDGEIMPEFKAAVQAVALMALQIERCRAYLAVHDHEDERGRWRPENDALDRKLAAYLKALDKLGATPTSYARLGFDVARGFDLAKHWADEDEQSG